MGELADVLAAVNLPHIVHQALGHTTDAHGEPTCGDVADRIAADLLYAVSTPVAPVPLADVLRDAGHHVGAAGWDWERMAAYLASRGVTPTVQPAVHDGSTVAQQSQADPERPSATWRPADRTVLAAMAPIVEGLCSGCGTKPVRETGSCRCLFRIDDVIRGKA